MPSSRPLLLASLGLAALVAGCGPSDPQLAMCQKLANGLVGNIADWERTDQNDSTRARNIEIAYSTKADSSGSIDCRYPIDRESGAVATAPDQVMLNGERVTTRELLTAGAKASKELISETAEETAERTREVAGEASVKAREVAGEASEIAREVAGDASVKAREMADKLLDETAKGAKALQETLGN